MLARLMLLVVSLFPVAGCQQQKSAFDDWLPPTPKPQRVIILKSDEVNPKGKVATTTMVIVTEPKGVNRPEVHLIRVSVDDQRLYAYGEDKEFPLATFPVSTALGGRVLPLDVKSDKPHDHLGNFTIFQKIIDCWSDAYNCPMPYALRYFEGHYIHATEPKFYPSLGQPASHGCIRLNLDNAKWLYAHTPVDCRLVIEK